MKHTVKGFITYEKNPWNAVARISFQTWEPTPNIFPNMVIVCEHSIEVEVPDNFDPRPEMIAKLREEEKKAMADFEFKVNQIRKQISELQAIELSPGAA